MDNLAAKILAYVEANHHCNTRIVELEEQFNHSSNEWRLYLQIQRIQLEELGLALALALKPRSELEKLL